MSNFKQNITGFIKGVTGKVFDKAKTASDATMQKNIQADDKCTGVTRKASTNCCPMCTDLAGIYDKKTAKHEGAYNFHSKDRCNVVPVFSKDTKITSSGKEASKLIARAKEHEKEVTSLLKSFEDENMALAGLDYRLKGKESLQRKILNDASLKKCSIEDVSKNMKDVLRYTYKTNESTFYNCYKKVRTSLEENGYNFVRVKNSLKSKNQMYRGVNTIIQTPDGYLFELQFHTGKSLEVKEIVHKYYEEYRALKGNSKRRKELEETMIKISNQIPIPNGAEKVVL